MISLRFATIGTPASLQFELLAQYADGTSYVGQWKDNKREGHGVSVLSGGISYDGEVGSMHRLHARK